MIKTSPENYKTRKYSLENEKMRKDNEQKRHKEGKINGKNMR